MSLGEIVLDPDDPFDKIVFLEQNLHQEGFNSGFQNGHRSGQMEGFSTGLIYGKELGKEVGFYKGFIETYQLILSERTCSKRVSNLFSQITNLIDTLNFDNAEDESIGNLMTQIRNKFKQLSSLLKVPVQNNDQSMAF